ncbi:MAG: non-canonical purine NTP pyrophosphatase, partial [Gemmatimonadota bacterium]
MRLVLATANPHKIREISALFPPAGFTLVPATACLPDWHVEETGATLAANAELKARAAAVATG